MGLNLNYILKRIGFALITLFVAITIDFILPRLMGGNAADVIASQSALGSQKVAAALSKEFGLSNPNILYQYKQYWIQLFHGNLGISYVNYPEPVSHVILSALPWTLGVVLVGTTISYCVGWLLGILGAWKAGSLVDTTTLFTSFFMNAVPYFWVAIIILMIFAYALGWFPLGQAISSNFNAYSFLGKVGDIIDHAFLPTISLVLASIAGHLIVIRNNMIAVLSEDYMVLAKAKGLSVRRRKYMYGARNALLPSFTGFMTSLGYVIGGAITIEIVFSYPGIGTVTFNAILNHDYPVIQGAFLFIAISVICFNLIADLVYPIIDPRVTLQ